MPIPGLSYTDEELFPIINIILPCWLLLIIAPGHKLTQALCLLASFALSILYALLLWGQLKDAPAGHNPLKDMLTLPGIIALFRNPQIVFLGWVHYCVADLWVGRWIAIDAGRRHMPRLLVAPILVLACLFGPCGLGLYFLVRSPFPEHYTAKAKAH